MLVENILLPILDMCVIITDVFSYNKLGHAEAVSVELSYSKGADTIDEQTLGGLSY